MKPTTPDNAEFDRYADDYDRALAQGIGVSGEDKDFFAEGRIRWLAGRLSELGLPAKSVMDFGCGTGSATPYLFDILCSDRVVGLDVSSKSLDIARNKYSEYSTAFELVGEYPAAGDIDVVYCNGTFHHIPPPERATSLQTIFDSLRPGGIFALWENNPWNPGTQYVMWRCPFDNDAIKVSPPVATRLVKSAGFDVLKVDFYFIFPRFLSGLRRLEPSLSSLPLGAQYQVLCRKPE